MPVYSYVCTSCEDRFDRFISFSRKDEPKETPCAKCGGEIREEFFAPKLNFNDVKPSGEFKELLQKIESGHKSRIPVK